jgi:hypothetical protein
VWILASAAGPIGEQRAWAPVFWFTASRTRLRLQALLAAPESRVALIGLPLGGEPGARCVQSCEHCCTVVERLWNAILWFTPLNRAH